MAKVVVVTILVISFFISFESFSISFYLVIVLK